MAKQEPITYGDFGNAVDKRSGGIRGWHRLFALSELDEDKIKSKKIWKFFMEMLYVLELLKNDFFMNKLKSNEKIS